MEREWRLPLSSDSCPVPLGATSPIVLQPPSSGALPLHTLPKGATASFAHLGFYEVISVRRTELRGAWWSPFSNPLSPSALFPVSALASPPGWIFLFPFKYTGSFSTLLPLPLLFDYSPSRQQEKD